MELMEKVSKTELLRDELWVKTIAIYKSIEAEYEAKYMGKFLAIDTDSKKVFMGDTWEEAMDLSEKERLPGQVFCILRVGYLTPRLMQLHSEST